jgi:CDP-glycerol glycerophosphotransferase (TagB/SpsB family)
VARRVFGIGSGSKIVLWLPTFRHLCNPNGDKRSDYSVSGRDEFNLLTDNTLSGLDVVLGELNIFIIVKYHPNQDLDYVSTSRDYKNILTLTSDEFVKYGIGLYQVLSETDALIADFSSVYIDFLLRDRPIAFDVTDMEDYSNGIGFTVDNPREYMPGPFISGIDDLKSFLTDVYKGVDGYSDERKRVRDIVHQYRDGNSTERLLDYYGLYKG